MTFLSNVFLWKDMTGVGLNTFPNVLLMFNIYQYLLMISLLFGKVGLCFRLQLVKSLVVIIYFFETKMPTVVIINY